MAQLVEKRRQAEARVDQIEAEARTSRQRFAEAREALIQAEASGVPEAKRRTLERELAEAEARAGEPWGERVEGARRAVRQRQAEVQQFVSENLSQLVAALEADGQAIAAKLNEHAEGLVTAYAERERIAGEISQLVSSAEVHVKFGDISFSRADELARAASTLIETGGESPPKWRDPREPRHAQLAETSAA